MKQDAIFINLSRGFVADLGALKQHLPNQWVNLGMSFRYFFVRKTMFVKYSSGVIVCPGGLTS